MRTLLWLGRMLLVPAIGVGLLIAWVTVELARGEYDMSAWAALLLFGGFAMSRAAPRVALIALFGAFVLQFARVVCRFGTDGWIAYAAIPFAAVVLGAVVMTHRRRTLGLLMTLGALTGLFANVPALGRLDAFGGTSLDLSETVVHPLALWGFIDGIGVVNGKTWSWPPTFGTGEIVIGTLVWMAGAVLLVLGGWRIGSSSRAQRLQWAAEARSQEDRAALNLGTADLRLAEQRDRIAQEVHDLTAHRLSVILAQADGAAAHAGDAGTRAALATISGSARTALTEIRTLLENLEEAPDGDTAHGVRDVRSLVAQAVGDGVTVELEEHGTPVPLSAPAGLAAYRITQEALTNAIRHGGAGAIRVTLDWEPDGLALFVASPLLSDGPREDGAPGRGLSGMRERARSVGGWLTAGRDEDAYVVSARLPSSAAGLPT